MCVCVFLQYPNKSVALVASDILHLLISYVDHLQKFPPDTPKKIVEVRTPGGLQKLPIKRASFGRVALPIWSIVCCNG